MAQAAGPTELSTRTSGKNVVIKRVEKSFGRTKVLKGVDLDIKDGEFVILLGPSGCGKTTLLRIIAGLEHADAGEVWISGRRVDGLEPIERKVAMVFQSYALYPHMTVYNNQAFSMKLRKVPQAGDPRAASIVPRARWNWRTFSTAYPRAAVRRPAPARSMGRAIVRSPKVFLFDEPLSNLDAQLRVHMRGEIKALHHHLGTTSIYVTHDQVEAMTMGDRIVVMNGGVVEQIGTPARGLRSPAQHVRREFRRLAGDELH